MNKKTKENKTEDKLKADPSVTKDDTKSKSPNKGNNNNPAPKDSNKSKNETTDKSKDKKLQKKNSKISSSDIDNKVNEVNQEQNDLTEKESKDPIFNLKKEDILSRIKECEEKIKQEKEERRNYLENKNKEIESKDKIIVSITSDNKKLMNELEYLKREVDDKLDKIGIKEVQIKEKELIRKKKEKPLEQVLIMKEKELKNAINLLEIYKKDKENLEKIYNKSDAMKLIEMQEKLRGEEAKNHELEIEIRSYMRLNEDHLKCELVKEECYNNTKILKNELNYLKEKNKELSNKYKNEEDKNVKMNENVLQIKSKIDKSNLPNIVNNNPKNGKLFENHKKKSSEKFLLTQEDKIPQILMEQKKKFSESIQNKNFHYDNMTKQILFNAEEKENLTKILNKNEVEKFEKRYETLEQTKFTIEKKMKTDFKNLKKRMEDLEERTEFTQLQNKEGEEKNKILSFQINEFKIENRLLQKKVLDLQINLERLNQNISLKQEENKNLVLKLQEYQKKLDNSRITDKLDNDEIEDNDDVRKSSNFE